MGGAMIDVERLLAEALAKHGIRLDPNDPAVVLVTLNRLVLEDTSKGLVAEMRKATSEFEQAAGRIQSRFGAALAMNVKAGSSSEAFLSSWSRRACVALGFGSATGVFLSGLVVGRWLLR
jgi:hypothetical protein